MGSISAITSGGRRLALLLTVLITSLAWAADNELTQRQVDFNIKAQSLASALLEFAAQTRVQVMSQEGDLARRQTAGVTGRHTIAAALTQLLANTNLEYTTTAPNTIAIAPSARPQTSAVDADNSVEVVANRVRMAEIGGYATKLRETPQSITIVDRAQMDAQLMYTLDDVMMKTPGVVVMQETSDEYYYYFRGQPVNSFQWDGLTMESFAYLNNAPNMTMFDEVQILRGANGVLNSAKSFGSVNLIRKRPTDQLKAYAMLTQGSWDNFRAEADVGGPLVDSGRLRGRVAASYGDRDYFYDVGKRRETLVYGLMEFDVTPDTLLTVSASDQSLKSTPFVSGMPRYEDGGSLGLSRSKYFGSDWNRFTADSVNAYLSLQHRFNDAWSIKLAGSRLDADSGYKYSYVWGAVDRETGEGAGLYGNAYAFDFTQDVYDLSVQGRFGLFGREHGLVFGASYYVNDYAYHYADISEEIYTPVDVFNWDPSSVAEPADIPWQSEGLNWHDVYRSLYATARFSLADRLTLTAGARATWYTHRFDEFYLGELYNREDVQEDGIITPYAGLTFDLTDNWSVYLSYADMFTPQTAQTFEGKTLDPEIGANYEAGIKGELFNGRLNASLAAFRVEKSNEAMEDLRYNPMDYGGRTFYLATGETRSSGVELEVTGRPLPQWSVSGGYTRNTNKIVKALDDVGQPFASWVPKHMLRVWTDYRLPFAAERWSLGGSLSAQSEVVRPTGTSEANIRQGSFALLGLRLSYRYNDTWTFALNGDNLTDEIYYPKTGSSVNCCNMYGEPRSVTLTVRGSL